MHAYLSMQSINFISCFISLSPLHTKKNFISCYVNIFCIWLLFILILPSVFRFSFIEWNVQFSWICIKYIFTVFALAQIYILVICLALCPVYLFFFQNVKIKFKIYYGRYAISQCAVSDSLCLSVYMGECVCSIHHFAIR